MKRIITICICILMATALLAGCAPKAEAATPSPTPEVTEAVTPEVTPEVTPTPEPQPVFESTGYVVRLTNAPEDVKIDERYTAVKFEDGEYDISASADISLEEVTMAADPGFTLYWFEDADGVTQYRAYGEKYELLTRTDVDGTVTEFVAVTSIESGLYPVTVTRVDGGGLTFTVDPAAVPVTVDNFPVPEDETKATSKPTATPKANSGSKGGGSTGGTSGGGSAATPAPATTPAPAADPAPAPAADPTPAPPVADPAPTAPTPPPGLFDQPDNPQIPIGGGW